MDAPNKIYLNEDGYGVQTVWSTYPSDVLPSHEYIRKDALLKWAKENQEKCFSVVEYDLFQEVIDKLNSM